MVSFVASMKIGHGRECTWGTTRLMRFQTKTFRLSAVQFCSIIFGSSSLIAAAVILFLTGACYGKLIFRMVS